MLKQSDYSYLDLSYYRGFVIVNNNNNNNNNNRTFFDLQVPNSPSKLRFEANLSREDSQITEHSQKPKMISYKENGLRRKSLIKLISFEISSK